MTSYGAYDAGLPCKNTSCKSHGKPHPNCECYPGRMAEGGEVKSFCSGTKSHSPDCEYYTEPMDQAHAVSGYIAHQGLHGLLKMGLDHDDDAMDKYHHSVKKGHKHLDIELEKLFSGGKSEVGDLSKHKKYIEDWINRGGIANDLNDELYKQNAPQDFAKGGEVKKHHSGVHGHSIEKENHPHNMMLNIVKGRAAGYLGGLKPQPHQPKLAFDDEPDHTQQKKSYDRALDLAVHPMGILDKIKKGTVEPEHLKHFNAMHPELGDTLQKKLTEQIINMQMKGEKPSYKVRQGLSMFMGTPLSSEMTPANIQAAQACFQVQGGQSQQGGQSAPAKKTSALAKAPQSFLTANDAAASRQQKQ